MGVCSLSFFFFERTVFRRFLMNVIETGRYRTNNSTRKWLKSHHDSNGRDKFRYSTYFNSLRNVLGLGAGATGFLADCFVKHQSTSEKTIINAVDREEMIIRKNVIKLTSEGMFWANTIAAEMAVK